MTTATAPAAIRPLAAVHLREALTAAVRTVLAESAAERATRTAGPDTAPPDGGEGAPTPADARPVPLAIVLAFPEGRVRRAA
ncbi:hypothetical protein ACFP3U_31570 [Kitasatospora misakiensis]|uniref:Uncharacterized protein n=1 Tax=Kitasatospora misakiensis TaxID=67330 RepID=A0ABW0XEJ6_9ACTN